MFINQTMASDIAHSLRNNTQGNSLTENYIELGIFGFTGVLPSVKEDDDGVSGIGILANGSFNINGFFIEKQGESQEPFVFGYNAYDDDLWSFDIVIATTFGGLPDDDRFKDLDARRASIMLGGRLTGNVFGNTIQLLAKTDVSSHSNGTTFSALLGRNWQIRNLNLHAMIGLNYIDDNQSNYYYGINQKEANKTTFETYRAADHYSTRLEIGVTYPLTQHWVFRATGQAFTVSNEVTDSPLFLNKRKGGALLESSLSYVF